MPIINEKTAQELQKFKDHTAGEPKMLLKLKGRTLTVVEATSPRDKLYRFLARFGFGPLSLAKIINHINTLEATPEYKALLDAVKETLASKVEQYNGKKFRRHVSEEAIAQLGQRTLDIKPAEVSVDIQLATIFNELLEADTEGTLKAASRKFDHLVKSLSTKTPDIENQISMIKDAIAAKKTAAAEEVKHPQDLKVGYGIENGGNSCYLDSVVQALRFVPLDQMHGFSGILKQNRILDTLTKKPIEETNAQALQFFDANRADIEELYRDSKKLKIIPQQAHPFKIAQEITTTEKLDAIRQVLERGYVTPEEAEDLKLFFTEMKETVSRIQQTRQKIKKMHKALAKGTVTMKEINEFRNYLIDKCGFANAEARYSQEDAAEVCSAMLQAAAAQPFSYYNGEMEETDLMLRLELKGGASDMGELLQGIEFNPALPIPHVLPIQLDRYPENSREKNKAPIEPPKEIVMNVAYDGEPVMYRLASVVVHSGSTPRYGHYYTYVPQEDGSWVKFDDPRVSNHPAADIQNDIAQNGLIYFYERIVILEE